MRKKSSKSRQRNQATRKARKNAKRKARRAASQPRASFPRPPRARNPQRREVDTALLHSIIEKATQLSDEERKLLTDAVDTLTIVTNELAGAKASIQRLRRLLFGSSTESTQSVLDQIRRRGKDSPNDASSEAAASESSSSAAESSESHGDRDGAANRKTAKSKKSGHGRIPASAYLSAKQIRVPHGNLEPGAPCPDCKDNPSPKLRTGKVTLIDPSKLVRVRGVSPLEATVYSLERYRCHLCGTTFKAEPPPGVGETKYDETARSMVALMKYGCGLPFNRLEKLGKELGIPLPSSTLWDLMAETASVLEPIWHELIRQAAAGDVVHIDDTNATVLSLLKEINEARKLGKAKRTGIFTTGVVSKLGRRRLAIFFTSKRHAGENLSRVLAERRTAGPPILMCDALSRNSSGDFEVILSHCLVHARRNFVDLTTSFPDEVERVVLAFKEVYRNEAEVRERGLSDEERLAYHREHSLPRLEELRRWLAELVQTKQVEPNSPFGKAIAYFENHWTTLTRFCEVVGAPLDNNLCERALKRIIIHRKNSLFYKTENGARVGDLFLSLIQSAELNGESAFEYLTALQRNAVDVAESPELWLPWCYRRRLEALTGESAAVE